MIPELRRIFNDNFDERRYHLFMERVNRRFGVPITFRVNPSPLFVPRGLQETCEKAAVEFTLRLHEPDYLRGTDRALDPSVAVAGQPERSTFMSVDFALIEGDSGVEPRLIELQGFPSLMGYQLLYAELLQEHYELPTDITPINGGLSRAEYIAILRDAVVSDAVLDEVVLLELDPWNQKTCPDFAAIRELLGIDVVDIRDVRKEGRRLTYRNSQGRWTQIRRIFNRTIVDEIERRNVELPFRWNDDLEVEWAGHPNWYFRISKFSLPFLDHPYVPKASFLSDLNEYPADLDRYVLKPLYSFAGTGVIVGPNREDLDGIPAGERENYLLQRRIRFADVLDTPIGPVRAELRIMLVWPESSVEPIPVMSLVRTGTGEKMGVDARLPEEADSWIGASCAFYESGSD